PSLPIFWRRNILLVPEWMQDLLSGKLFWHETDFDERLHAIRQQAVVYLAYVGKIVARILLRIFTVDPGFVMEDRMKSHVLKAGDLFCFTQIASIAFTQA